MITETLMFLMRRSMCEASRLKLQFVPEHLYFSRFLGTPLLHFNSLIDPSLSRNPDTPRILWGPKIPKPATVRNTTFFVKLYHKEHIFRS